MITFPYVLLDKSPSTWSYLILYLDIFFFSVQKTVLNALKKNLLSKLIQSSLGDATQAATAVETLAALIKLSADIADIRDLMEILPDALQKEDSFERSLSARHLQVIGSQHVRFSSFFFFFFHTAPCQVAAGGRHHGEAARLSRRRSNVEEAGHRFGPQVSDRFLRSRERSGRNHPRAKRLGKTAETRGRLTGHSQENSLQKKKKSLNGIVSCWFCRFDFWPCAISAQTSTDEIAADDWNAFVKNGLKWASHYSFFHFLTKKYHRGCDLLQVPLQRWEFPQHPEEPFGSDVPARRHPNRSNPARHRPHDDQQPLLVPAHHVGLWRRRLEQEASQRCGNCSGITENVNSGFSMNSWTYFFFFFSALFRSFGVTPPLLGEEMSNSVQHESFLGTFGSIRSHTQRYR